LGETARSTALPRFLLLYAAFGVASPFLPALVNARGVPAAQLGLVLSAGTAIRLITAPLAGRLGDFIQGLRLGLVGCLGLAAVVTLGYLPAQGFGPFLALSLGHAAALAPVTILAAALAAGRGCAATRQRPARVRVRLGAWDGLGGLHRGHLAVAALAGMLRWAVLALVQPLHGLTFALLHLACMVPPGLEGTAQALYGTVGIGVASAGLTLVSGVLYARVGVQGF
jgi:PPP family 3-phenylpropionic acid transporter